MSMNKLYVAIGMDYSWLASNGNLANWTTTAALDI